LRSWMLRGSASRHPPLDFYLPLLYHALENPLFLSQGEKRGDERDHKKGRVKGLPPGGHRQGGRTARILLLSHWGFGPYFEAKVAAELSEFISRFQSDRDGFWTACVEDRVKGSIVIDGPKHGSEGAHLRWFILSSDLRGRGIGCKLMEQAVAFCRAHDYRRVYLWTFEGLTRQGTSTRSLDSHSWKNGRGNSGARGSKNRNSC
jgi:GNAT superfamily N-acetyltransferase